MAKRFEPFDWVADAFSRSKVGPRAVEFSAACTWLSTKRDRYAWAVEPGVIRLGGDLARKKDKLRKEDKNRVFWCTETEARAVGDDWYRFKVHLKKAFREEAGFSLDENQRLNFLSIWHTASMAVCAVVLTCLVVTAPIGIALGTALPFSTEGTARLVDAASAREDELLGTDSADGTVTRVIGHVGGELWKASGEVSGNHDGGGGAGDELGQPTEVPRTADALDDTVPEEGAYPAWYWQVREHGYTDEQIRAYCQQARPDLLAQLPPRTTTLARSRPVGMTRTRPR